MRPGFALSLAVLAVAVACPPPAAAAPASDVVPVLGRAVTPNAFQPALPCTLLLAPPGNALLAPGLRMIADRPVSPTVNGDFAYLPFGPDDYDFDQVNVFWHAQQFLARLARYGLDPNEIPIFVHVQVGIGSSTNPTEPAPTIGTGQNGLFEDAKDNDIIVHEMTHGVFNPRMPTDVWPFDKGEASPVAEGIADYFAAAVNGDTHIGEYASPPNGYHDIASDPAVYNYASWDQLPGDPYSRGKVLNGALLELRAAIGETADELVFAALAHKPLRCMPCVGDAIRWADADRFGGAHMAAIDAAFAHRAIPGGSPVGVQIKAPPFTWTDSTYTFRVQPHCGFGPFDNAWATSTDNGATWQPLPGNADSVAIEPIGPFTLRVRVRDRRGAETTPSTPVLVYDASDTTLRFRGIHIVGPTHLISHEVTSYRFALDGGPGVLPPQIRWSVQGASLFGSRETDPVIAIAGPPGPVRIALRYADAVGRTVSDTLNGTIDLQGRQVRGIRIDGPAVLDSGQLGSYAYAIEGGPGIDPIRIRWTIAGGAFSGPTDNQPVVRLFSSLGPVTLGVTFSDAAQQVVSSQRVVTIAQPFHVAIDGPDSVQFGAPAVFSAIVGGGLAPYAFHWTRSTATGWTALPDGPVAILASCLATFTISLAATDARGVGTGESTLVTVPVAPPTVPRLFRALGSVVPGSGAVAFEFPPDPGGGTLAVLDPAGRVRLTLRLAADGATALTLPLAHALEPGLYFARLVRPSGVRVARFVVVPG